MIPLLLATALAVLPATATAGVAVPEAPPPPALAPAPHNPSPPALSPSRGAGERGPAEPPAASVPPPPSSATATPPATPPNSPSPPALSPSRGAGERGPVEPPAASVPPTPSSVPPTPSSVPPPPSEATATSPATSPATPRATPPPTWYDEGHAIVSEGLLWSVERLDRFFGDERELDLPRARSFVRWRNDLKIHEDGTLGFTTGLRADLSLPSLDQRLEKLHLTLSAGTTDALDRLLGAENPAPDASDQPSAGLRLDLLRTLLTQTDLQAGLIASLPVGWYTRLRLRFARPVEDLFVARGALSVFWQTPTGWGTRQDGRLERRLTPWLELRLDGTGTITERSRGWEWAAELAALAAAGDRVALLLGGGPSGATDLGPVVEVWRVHARARRDVLRRWIFVEVEPGIDWRRPALGGPRERDRYVILRLEVQFDAALREARPPRPAEPPPEAPAAPAAPPDQPAPPGQPDQPDQPAPSDQPAPPGQPQASAPPPGAAPAGR